MLYRTILAALLSLGLISGAQATTVTTTDTSSVADTVVCESGTGGITTKKCSPAVTSTQIITSTDTSSVADTLMCEAGTAGITGKKCVGPITASQVVTTPGSSSVAGELACMSGTTGKVIAGCGYSAITTLGAYQMLANTSASAAAPTGLTPTGSYGVPVLSGGSPAFTGARIYLKNTDSTSSTSVLEMQNMAPVVNTGSSSVQSVVKDSAAALITAGAMALIPTNITSGSVAARYDISTYDAGVSTYQLRLGGGVQAGVPTGAAKGAGTINAAGTYYADGTAGVTCASVSAATMTTKNGLITHC